MRLIRATVAAPVVSDAARAHAFALAREKALSTNADRALMLVSAAAELERWIGAAYFGSNRVSVATVEVLDVSEDLSTAPTLPDTGMIVPGTVERWDDASGAFAATTAYTVRPAGRIRVHAIGTYRLTSMLSGPVAPPAEVIEAVARIWAWRENQRPGDADISEVALNLSGAVMRSGAAEVVRHLRIVSL